MRGYSRGACVVASEGVGMHGCSWGGAWLLQGVCMVAPRGACMVAPGGACMGYDKIQRYDQ